jgi:hypothetical protein
MAAISILTGFIIYGAIAPLVDWITKPETPPPPPTLEAAFGRIVIRWLIRGLLVAFLSALVFAAMLFF